METSLQSLLDLAGVNAAMVYDGAGRLVAQRGKAVYDRGLCEQVGAPLGKAVDSIQLQHEDWEAVTARYADGTVILRNLGEVAGASYVLAVVADATLNPAFAAVAIRVAATKLRKLLGGAGASMVALPTSLGSSVGPPPGPGGSQVGELQLRFHYNIRLQTNGRLLCGMTLFKHMMKAKKLPDF